jgi:hypothetical protein
MLDNNKLKGYGQSARKDISRLMINVAPGFQYSIKV